MRVFDDRDLWWLAFDEVAGAWRTAEEAFRARVAEPGGIQAVTAEEFERVVAAVLELLWMVRVGWVITTEGLPVPMVGEGEWTGHLVPGRWWIQPAPDGEAP
jgi:hypothetical protein